jgi:hypothetical protein
MLWGFRQTISILLLLAAIAVQAASVPDPATLSPEGVRAILLADPSALIPWSRGPVTPQLQLGRGRLAFELEKVPNKVAREFLLASLEQGDAAWGRLITTRLNGMGYVRANSILKGDFESVFRLLARDLDNLHGLGEMLFAEGTPEHAFRKYLNVVEGKLYEQTVAIELRRRIAEQLLFGLGKKAAGNPEVLELYDRLHAGRLIRSEEARHFLDEVHGTGQKELQEWVAERQAVLDGRAKEAWRTPYKPVPGLPKSTYQQHEVPIFDPVPGKFEGVRRLNQLSYPTQFSRARQKFQNGLMEKLLERGQTSHYPRIIFTSGPLGSGKSTSLQELESLGYLPKGEFLLIDPDEVRELLPEYKDFLKGPYSDYAAHLTHHEAMQISDMMMEKALKEGKNIVVSASMRDHLHYSKLVERVRKTSPNYTLEMVRINRAPEKVLEVNQGKNLISRRGRITPMPLVVNSIVEVEETAGKMEPMFDRVVQIDNNGAKPLIAAIRNRPRPEGRRIAHAFFDLDWTIVYPLSKPASSYGGEGWKLVEAQGQAYRVSEHLDELVEEIRRNPHVRMGIASGGTTARNIELLKAIKPPSLEGKSLYDFIDILISNEDLRKGKAGAKAFDRLMRKPINEPIMVTGDFALFDDQRGWIRSLGGKGAWTGKTYEYFPTWKDAKAAIGNPAFDQRFVPKSEAEWLAERDKLKRFRSILTNAAAELPTSKKTFGELVQKQTRLLNWGNLRCWRNALEMAIGR